MQGTEELGIKISRFVLDKGFISKHNIEYMLENGLDFILCANETTKVRECVIRNIEDVKDPENYILDHGTYGKPDKYDEKINIHIFHNSEKAASSEKDFYARIAMYENELQRLKTLDGKTARKYRNYFNITIKKDRSFTYEKDYGKIKEAHKLIGYFACLASEMELTSGEVIEIYRRKDSVEKCFDNLKHFAGGKRFRTHNDLTGQGKMFILFLSLIFKSYIDKIISLNTKATLTEKKKTIYSVEKIMLELSRIKIITINGITRLVQPITKKQRDILAWFQISEKDILDFVEKI
jgi:transposase